MNKIPGVGSPHLKVNGKEYNLIWGRDSLVVSDGNKVKAKIDNTRLSRMLGSMSLTDFVGREIVRQG